jgi:predicted ATPase
LLLFFLFFSLHFPACHSTHPLVRVFFTGRQNFHTVFVHGVPQMQASERNLARRFILLVDSLYEGNCRVVLFADAEPAELLQISAEDKATSQYDEHFAFDRAISRILEMQSDEWIDKWASSRDPYRETPNNDT